MKRAIALCLVAGMISCNQVIKKEDHHVIEVRKAENPPTLDGKATENCWNMATWYALDQNWVGDAYSHEDFNGRYKLCWDKDALYFLVEITDDILYDRHKDPLKLWWDDDCLEVFVDEDNSGGLHQFSHNAFAYHIALDGNVVDLAPDRSPRLYNDHVTSARSTEENTTVWEVSLKLFDHTYRDNGSNTPKKLSKNKKIGFALAYCDNDGSKERENFIGSVFVPGEDKDQGWINADIFGTLILQE